MPKELRMPLQLDSNTSSLLRVAVGRVVNVAVLVLGALVAPVAVGVVAAKALRVLADVGTLRTGLRARGNR